MATVRQILDLKTPRVVVTLSPDATNYEALQLMAKHNIGCVAIVENERLVGLLTEREYARRIVLQGKTSRHTPIRETMIDKLLVVDPDKTVEDCMKLMSDKHIRYLPVIDKDEFVGIVSIGDVVKTMLAQQRQNIEHLERYISGGEYGSA
jgi:CBS domain-containing protein